MISFGSKFTLRILERIAQFSEGGKMGISIGLGRAFLCKQISCADAHFPITSKLQSSNNSFILITLAFIGYGTNVRDKT